MITAQNILFKRGETTIFEGLSFVVHAGQKVGIVGRNGVGKSTLFRFFRDGLEPDTGDLTFPDGWRISRLRQEVDGGARPALEFVIDGHRDLRNVETALARAEADPDTDGATLAALHARFDDLGGHTAPAQAAAILHGLGFDADALQRPFNAFSGGWRIRLGLAQALMQPADLLLLDEPTNHLDLEATLWLEQFLSRFDGTLLVIAHDRQFLDHVCSHTLHLIQGTARVYRGGYTQFERARAEEALRETRQAEKRDAEVEHIRKFVSRFRAKASKAAQVQSRLRVLEKLLDVAPARVDSPYRVTFPNPDRMSNPLLHLRDVSIGYGAVTVLRRISLSLLPGDRVGVLGANGAGKTTLLRALVGDLPVQQGDFSRGDYASTGYFSQHQMEVLDGSLTPLAQCIRHAPSLTQQAARNLLGGWGFDGTMVERPISTLSGGEKARLVLALIAYDKPAILVLDEPTNHLDIEMRDALALALQNYEGALVVVSHDRHMIEAVCDELWLVRDGGAGRFKGSLDDYLALQRMPADVEDGSRNEMGAGASRRADRQQRAAARQQRSEERKALKRLEADMEKTASALKQLESRLADPEVYAGLSQDELTGLLRDAAATRQRLESIENAWMQAAEALETDDA
ncbi:MAG: ATP-binding cassette domain-containing protein [Pseudomonadales bacterium]|nr:ATP-binding cassette domain-containing protein [Pseudomonadales bacterium]MCP5184127.1 ATP-binding cassette domain-containing protein [Pseudomonadales bacterium]